MFISRGCSECDSFVTGFNTVANQLSELSLDWQLATLVCSEQVTQGKIELYSVPVCLISFEIDISSVRCSTKCIQI